MNLARTKRTLELSKKILIKQNIIFSRKESIEMLNAELINNWETPGNVHENARRAFGEPEWINKLLKEKQKNRIILLLEGTTLRLEQPKNSRSLSSS